MSNDTDLNRDDSADRIKPFWQIDGKMPASFIYVVVSGFVAGILWVGNVAWTVNQHTSQLAGVQATIQARATAIASIEVISAQVGQLSTAMTTLAATNQRLTSLEASISELRTEANAVATHERRIAMLEQFNVDTGRRLDMISDRLAHIEAKLDTLGNGQANRSDRR